MKQIYKQFALTFLVLLASVSVMAYKYSYDFEVDGILYTKINSTKVKVVTKMLAGDGKIYEYQYKGDIVIPETVKYGGNSYRVTAIGKDAFNGAAITSISLPRTITTIEPNAFYNCSLSSITLPENVDSIGHLAFFSCKKLSKVNIPNGVSTLWNHTFANCPIQSIHIPETVRKLESYVFKDCKSLTSVTGLAGVTSIGEKSFYNCEKLESITLPQGLLNLGKAAFMGCTSLTTVTIPNGVKLIGSECFSGCNQLKSVTFSEGIECIADEAFSHCEALTSIHIPSSLKWIANKAFEYCTNLSSIEVSKQNAYFDSRDESNAIISKHKREGSYVLYTNGQYTSYAPFNYKENEIIVGCSGLKIPQTVTYCSSLYGCNLPSLTIPKKFIYLASLYDCYIGEACVDEENETYDSRENCHAIIETATNTMRVVSSKTFIPNGITEIRGDFRPYTEMRNLYIYSKTPPTLFNSISQFTNEQFQNMTLYVPKGSKNAYEKTSGWDNFWNIKEFDSTEIDTPTVNDVAESAIYDIRGYRTESCKKGLYIIKMSNGTAKKVFLK